MSDEYLAEWRPYKVTAEQLPKLQRKEKEAIDAFYLENRDELNKLADGYWNRKFSVHTCCMPEDVQQDLYANLFLNDISFDTKNLFRGTIRRSLAYSTIGGAWSPIGLSSTTHRNGLRNNSVYMTKIILDREITDGDGDTFVDKLRDGEDPHIVLMRARHIQWRERFELALDKFLESILPPYYFEMWQARCEMNKRCRNAILKHKDEILQFMRSHGVPEHVLQWRAETSEEREARIEAQKALEAWQEEHVDELPHDLQVIVRHRLRLRYERERRRCFADEINARRRERRHQMKAEKARASA